MCYKLLSLLSFVSIIFNASFSIKIPSPNNLKKVYSIAEAHNVPATFIRRANEVNREMAEYVVKRVEFDNAPGLAGKNILVVGVAYKPNVADTRETAAELVIEHLRSRGANVIWHDELVSEWNGEKSSPLGGADITIVLTKHDVDSSPLILDSAPYVFDTTGSISGARGL